MSSERYKCTLSDEALQFCALQLSEPQDNEARLEEINKLKTAFKEKYPSLTLVREDDGFLLRFLRSRKFDQQCALQALGCYHKLRNEWREVFDLVEDKSKVEKSLNGGDVLSPKGRAKDGSFIVIQRPGISGESVASFVASVFLSYEELLKDEEAQVYGFTVIADVSSLGLGFAMKLASSARRFVEMLQEVLPIRLNKLNVVNEGFVFYIVYTVARQFMKNNFREKVKLHNSNLSGLQEFISEDVLPPSLGGKGEEIDAQQYTRKILDSD